MNTKKMLIGLVLFFVTIAALLLVINKPTAAQTAAAGAGANTDIMKKLEDIAKDQKAILDDLAAIKQELYIVKIRVSQNQ